jgi:hypothetical protein
MKAPRGVDETQLEPKLAIELLIADVEINNSEM